MVGRGPHVGVRGVPRVVGAHVAVLRVGVPGGVVRGALEGLRGALRGPWLRWRSREGGGGGGLHVHVRGASRRLQVPTGPPWVVGRGSVFQIMLLSSLNIENILDSNLIYKKCNILNNF